MVTKKVMRFKVPKDYSAQVRALQCSPYQRDLIMSFEHICKFHDALLFGASEEGVTLSVTYLIELKKFLIITRKRLHLKKEGAVDESNMDPFSKLVY